MLLTDSFLDYLLYERNYSEGTVRYYRTDILELQKFGEKLLGDLAPSDVGADLVREWIVSLMDKGYAPNTVNRKLSSVRTYYKYLLKKGLVAADPLRRVTGPKKKKPLPVFLREGEVDRLLDDVDFGERFEGYRDRLIIEMFYTTGMRLSELIGLDDKDVDFSASLIKVTGKRNKQRLIPFDKELGRSMQEYVNVRNQALPVCSDAFFVRKNGERLGRGIVAYIVRRNLSKVVTVKKRSPHVLRHTFATAMLNNGADLSSIKELLGHESLATTDIFGTMKNVAITSSQLEKALDNNCMFDGSSIEGFVRIEESDMYLYPDLDTLNVFPWRPQQGKVARLICDVYRPNREPFEGDPRYILKKVVKQAAELGYQFDVGPECEFFLYHTDDNGQPTTITHERAGYFDLGPMDLGENARRDMVLTLEDMGFEIEASHHEMAPAQHEIDFRYDEALTTADNIMTFKLAVKTIAKRHGLHASFMPKPKTGINGSGMHINMSLSKDGKNIFADDCDPNV